ncbi:HEAT repeat-containing protein 4 [Acropora cervicornis]|uniref:HEAT repeat-containing protein 4 n=1 Tax=Acropora cervicornis TaxID=6130 RepID=A0AAD9R3J5_ACRCE|nr:HEAT repeat-containing protein 4 [Acropora cervicornis]
MKEMDKMANVTTPGGVSTTCSAVADRVSTSRSHGAEFFAVASGVQIPYVGRDETGVNASRINSPSFSDEFPPRIPHHSLAPMILSSQSKQLPKDEPLAKLSELFSQYQPLADRRAKKVGRSYLKKISSGLMFDDMVLQDRAPHTLPYNENDVHAVFKSGGICNSKTQVIGLGGRHDPRGVVKRHALCHLKGPTKLKPLRRKLKTSPARADTGKLVSTTKLKGTHSSLGLTLAKGSERHEWDEYVLASLSQSTAKLIIKEQPSGSDKERLTSFLEKRIRESQGKTADGGLSDGATEEMKTSAIKKKAKDVKNRESKNTLEIHYSPSFALSPAVGDKKLETDNIFQQELLGGAQPVPSKKPSESSYIILDTNDKLKFQRQLQENYPQGSEVWYSKKRMPLKKATEKPQRKPSKLVKGLQRWKELPVVMQDDYYTPVVKESDIDVETFSTAYKEKKKMREDSTVVKIVEEWRSKWFLESHWQRCGTEELITAMGDINDHIRLSAVSACSKAAELRHAKKQEHHLGILLDKPKVPSESLEAHVEPELISAVTKLLDDRNPQVRVAAAITLYSLKKHNDNAKSILLWAMEYGGPPEKWAATQCLALSGVVTDKIIVELISQLHADNAVRTEKAGNLLAQLSQQSDVVQTLIAELLNSNSWKDRLTACKVIPKLRGGPNKDMTQKLSYLMWNDWNKDVRSTAAQALGKTGNGKLVHDALRERMLTGNDRIKVDALKKVSLLGMIKTLGFE